MAICLVARHQLMVGGYNEGEVARMRGSNLRKVS